MSRFYIRPSDKKGDKIYVSGKEAHHILGVMRLKVGDPVTAFDGVGGQYRGIIHETGKKSLVIKVKETEIKKLAKGYSITLAQAIPRKDKVDYIIQKAAELGVDNIIPMISKRTVVKIKGDKISAKLQRWEKIAREASKQCGRDTLTLIEKTVQFSQILNRAGSYDLAIMPSVGHIMRQSLKSLLLTFSGKSILIFIGPEGGFDPLELEAAANNGVRFVSLGENVLKCDTAALATIVMINYALTDI
ncbi:MAG: 16S rRNA (uracil(1498)-N(3))-methyltransferase [Candidatus Omnitrophota bacterium]